MLTTLQYGFIKRAEHIWKGLSNDKSQISPIPPESYGDRFLDFITNFTMTKEEVEREKESGDHREGSLSINRQITRTSTDKATNKATPQAQKTAKKGATENSTHDKTSVSVRGPSIDKSSNVGGAILPVLEEAGEAGSRDESMNNEKPGAASTNHETLPTALTSPITPSKDFSSFQDSKYPSSFQNPSPPQLQTPIITKELPSIPHLSRISMTSALGSSE